jgi:tetratricopeptide (TPR) repeat protein
VQPAPRTQRWVEAEEYARKALAGWRRARGDNARETLRSTHWLGQVVSRQGRLEEGEALIREAMQGQSRLLGDYDHDTLDSMFRLGQILVWRGELGRAEPLMETSFPRLLELIGEDNLVFGLAMFTAFANLRNEEGRLAEAERLLRDGISRMHARLGDDTRETWFSTALLGDVRRQQKDYAEAEQLIEGALAGLRRARVDDSTALRWLGFLRRDQGQLDESERCLREALEIRRRQQPDDPRFTWPVMLDLANVLARTGNADKTAEADSLQREYLQLHEAKFGPRDPWIFKSRRNVAGNLYSLGRLAEAAPFAQDAVEGSRSTLSVPNADMVKALGTLALITRDLGEPEKALTIFDEIDVAYRDHADALNPPVLEVWFGHADCLMSLGRFPEAEHVLLGALSGYAAKDRWLTGQVIDALIGLQDAWHAAEPGAGHDAKADEWRSRRSGAGGPDPGGPGPPAAADPASGGE